MNPLFSVVIPVYNRASIISRTLESILAQTLQDWECLVVDDFSSDKTKEVVMEYCNKDSRFRLLTNEYKKGANGARNTGIKQAKGKYVSFLDSDDEWSYLILEKQWQQYTSSEKIGCVYSNVQLKYPNNNLANFGGAMGIHGNIFSEALIQGYLAPTSVLSAKKDLLYKIGMFDLELPASQDDDICFKLTKECEVGYIPEVLAYLNIESNNRISDNSTKVSMGWWMLWNKHEADVINYCGEDVMAKHYKECLHNFIHTNNAEMAWKAYRKYSHFGGSLSKRKRLWFYIYTLSRGKNHQITKKTQNKI